MKEKSFKLGAVVILIAAVFNVGILCAGAWEKPETDDTAEIIDRLYDESGADELMYHIPDESREFLERIKFDSFKPDTVGNMSVENIFDGLSYILKENLYEPLRILLCVIGIILITAMFDTLKSGTLGSSLDSTLTLVCALCSTGVLAPQMLGLISSLSETVVNASNFMLVYVPVISMLIAASGQAVSAGSYCGIMIYVSNAILQLLSKVAVPLLKCIISISLIISVSDRVSLDGVSEMFKKTVRWVLTFCMSIFVAFMTMKSIVSTAEDSLSNKAVKFAISNFVPLVGGSLSDAYQTVVSCVTVLKSGVGVAAMAAVFAIFLPAVVRCVIWQFVLTVSGAVCDVFKISKTSCLLSSLSSVVSTICAVLLCIMVIYIISTAIVIIVGG
ncbi:MAG: hypothetical protein II685_01370 [Clostridia bacterium]|nr:hypothetical protein [Clostridia bacterium]